MNVTGYASDAIAHGLPGRSADRQVTSTALQAAHVPPAVTRTGGGSIVNVASMTGLDGNREQIAYGAAKLHLSGVVNAHSPILGHCS